MPEPRLKSGSLITEPQKTVLRRTTPVARERAPTLSEARLSSVSTSPHTLLGTINGRTCRDKTGGYELVPIARSSEAEKDKVAMRPPQIPPLAPPDADGRTPQIYLYS
jgi:hypothetical protein